MIAGAAVQGHRQNACDGSFSNAAVAAQDVAVSDPLLLDRIPEGARNMVLADHVGKPLRPVLTRQDLVAHGNSIINGIAFTFVSC